MMLTVFVVFVLTLLIGVPIGFGIGFAALVALYLDGSFPLAIIPQKIVAALDSFPLVAVPLFILAGALAGRTTIALRLVRFSEALVGHIRGGLGHVNVGASMFFGGISGSAVADTAAIGHLMIPQMEKQGYSRPDAGAVTICSSTIGVLIPPSIPLILYGVTVGTSIGELFLAGVVPGLLVGLLLMTAVFTMARRKRWPQRGQRAAAGELWTTFREAFLSLLLPFFLLSAIVSGIVTATEAGVIGVVYALLLGGAVYRDYTWRELYDIVVDSAINTAIPLFILATTSVVAWIVAIEQFPSTVLAFFDAMDFGRIALLLVINVFLVLVGMVLDLVPALILFAPILLPVAQAAGIDPIHFGVIMVMNLAVGLVTPPVGNCLYVGAVVANVRLTALMRATLPFLLANFTALLLVTYVPPLTLLLPGLFYR